MRMRILGYEVRPIILADDGDLLKPVSIDAQMLNPLQFRKFAEDPEKALDDIRKQIEASGKPE
jgi:hypothetical protein